SSRRRHTRSKRDWSSDVCSSDLFEHGLDDEIGGAKPRQIRSPGDAPDNARRLAALEDALLRGIGRELADRGEALCDGRGIAVARSEERRVGEESRGRGGAERGRG